jgi:hypothetical protein
MRRRSTSLLSVGFFFSSSLWAASPVPLLDTGVSLDSDGRIGVLKGPNESEYDRKLEGESPRVSRKWEEKIDGVTVRWGYDLSARRDGARTTVIEKSSQQQSKGLGFLDPWLGAITFHRANALTFEGGTLRVATTCDVDDPALILREWTPTFCATATAERCRRVRDAIARIEKRDLNDAAQLEQSAREIREFFDIDAAAIADGPRDLWKDMGLDMLRQQTEKPKLFNPPPRAPTPKEWVEEGLEAMRAVARLCEEYNSLWHVPASEVDASAESSRPGDPNGAGQNVRVGDPDARNGARHPVVR